MSLRGLSCIFPVPDIKKTEEYYVKKLGFRAVEYLECKEPHICLYRDDTEIILLRANTDKVLPNRTLYGYGYDAYLYTGNQEFLEKELGVMDATSAALCRDNNMPVLVFSLDDPDNIVRAIKGENIGTVVTG